MNNLYTLTENWYNRLLKEGIADVKKNYPDIADDLFMQIIALDPTYKEGKDSVGTYGKWILNLFKKKLLKKEDFYKVTEYLTEFEKKKKWFKNKDIGQFKSLPDLYDALQQVEVGELSKNQQDKQFKKEIKNTELHADVVYKDDKWTIYVPNDYEASCKLSSNTEWCTGISSKGDDYYYNHYTEEGPLYILHNNHDEDDKYQFHIPSNQYMNKSDRQIDLQKFLNESGNEGIKKFFLDKLLEPFLKELNISIDEPDSKEIKIILSEDDFEYMIQDIEGDNDRKVSGEWIIKLLQDPYEAMGYFDGDMSFSDNLSYIRNIELDNDIFTDLHRLGVDVNSTHDLITYLDESDDDIADDIKTAINVACSNARETGTQYQAEKDILGELEKCLPGCKINYTGDGAEITTTKGAIINLILETREDEDYDYTGEYIDTVLKVLKTSVEKYFKLYEPYYGWSGFDDDTYLETLDDNLYELVVAKEHQEEKQFKKDNPARLFDYDEDSKQFVPHTYDPEKDD